MQGMLRRVERAAEAMEDGESFVSALDEALRLREWERALLRSGEADGRLEQAFADWADVLRVRAVTRRMGAFQLSYVVSLVVAALFGLLLLALTVFPTLEAVLRSAGREPPHLTRFLVEATMLAWTVLPLVLTLALVLLLLAYGLSRLRGRVPAPLDALALRLRSVRACARVLGLRAAAASLAAGTGEAAALEAAARVQPRRLAREAWEKLARAARGGATGDLVAAPIIDAALARELRRAFESEEPVAALRGLAQAELARCWRAMERSLALIEPLLVTLVGLVIALSVIAWWAGILAATSAVP